LTPLPGSQFTCTELRDHPTPVYLITDCPSSYRVQFVVDRCRRGSAVDSPPAGEMFFVVPVTGRSSGLVYRNVYCAACHAEEDFTFWNVNVTETLCDDPTTSAAGVDDRNKWEFVHSFDLYFIFHNCILLNFSR